MFSCLVELLVAESIIVQLRTSNWDEIIARIKDEKNSLSNRVCTSCNNPVANVYDEVLEIVEMIQPTMSPDEYAQILENTHRTLFQQVMGIPVQISPR